MDLKVKRNDTGEIVSVRKYVKSENPAEQHIWSNEWYGHHVIGYDCEWCEGDKQPDTGGKCNKHGVNHRVCANCYYYFKGESEFDYCRLNGGKIGNIYKHTCNVYSDKIEWLRGHGG